MGLINIIKRIGISCCLLLAACDEWNQLSGANEGQVLVKVNDSEITILQYRNILYSLGILTPSDSVKQDIINKIKTDSKAAGQFGDLLTTLLKKK